MKIRLSTFLLLTILFVASGQRGLAQSLPGNHWEGGISVMGSVLRISVDFAGTGDSLKATIDIPQQGAKGISLKNVSHKPPKIHFELPAGPGLAVFDGKVQADSMYGDFSQAGIMGTFHLVQKEMQKEAASEAPVPYRQEEVTIQNGDVTLAGTLTLPPDKGRFPAVIMITGSGPQNRDEELFGFKPFRIIADHLTRKGIAVLRYDDRGVGGSTAGKAGATTADFATDVEAAVGFLRMRNDIDTNHIGLCGHSEGGIVAPMVAARDSRVTFIILMAGPAIPGGDIILYQIEHMAREGGASEKAVARAVALQKKVYACIHSDSGWDELKEEFRKDARASYDEATPEQRKGIADIDKLVETSVKARVESARSPWFKYFVEYDPAPTLAKVKCPVLAFFGELDQQVPVSLNKAPMEKVGKVARNNDFTVKVVPSANHLFLKARTGSTSEYADLPKEFVAGFLDSMSNWVQAHVKP